MLTWPREVAAARTRKPEPMSQWVGSAVLAAGLLSALEVGLVCATLPMAASDVAGLLSFSVAVFGLFGVLSLVLATLLAWFERRLAIELPAASDVLALFVGAAGTAAGAFGLLTELSPRLASFRERTAPLLWAATFVFALFMFAGVRYLLRPFFARLLSRAPSLASPRLYVAILLSATCIGSMLLAHAGLGALHQPVLAGVAGGFALACLVVALRLTLPPRGWRLGRLALLVLGVAVLSGPLVVWRHPHARFVLYGYAHTAWPLGELVLDLVDFDGDGAAPAWLGGDDCAAFDEERAPAIREVPQDGIDQDCSGGDAPAPTKVDRAVDLWPDCSVTRPLSLVLVSVDGLRADAVTEAGAPRLWQAATRSLWFRRAYAPSTLTGTSIPSMFEARAVSDRAHANPLLPGRRSDVGITFVERFRRSGYQTAAFNPVALPRTLTSGFQSLNGPSIDPPPGLVQEDTSSAALTNAALEFLGRVGNRRFLLWVHYLDTHAPHVDPAKEVTSGTQRALYEREVLYVDFHLGRLLIGLDEKQLLGSTLVAFTADHGEDLGLRGREGHGPDAFEDSIHVPLVLWVPGCKAREIGEPVSLLQLGPTLGALAGVPVPGRPLFPGVRHDGLPVVAEAKFVGKRAFRRAVIRERYKLIVDVRRGGRALFDLESDPGETRNVYASEPAAASALEAAYQVWLDLPGQR